jgi:hypothetical protein
MLTQQPDAKFLLVPMAQEIANQPCDIGHAPAELKQKMTTWLNQERLAFGVDRMDWSLVEEGWNSKAGPYAASLEAVTARAAALRATVYAQSCEAVILVTHGAFLHFFTDDWTAFDGSKGTAYENCEFREFCWERDEQDTLHLKQVGGAKVKLGRPAGVYSHVLEGIEAVEGQDPRSIKLGK